MGCEATVDSTCRVLRVFAARAVATSPSAWSARWQPSGHRKIGLAYFVPNSSTLMSSLLTSTSRRVRSCWRPYARWLAFSVSSPSTPVIR